MKDKAMRLEFATDFGFRPHTGFRGLMHREHNRSVFYYLRNWRSMLLEWAGA